MKNRLAKMLFLSLFILGSGNGVNQLFAHSANSSSVQQMKKIQGEVVDEKGEPLIGVSVLVKGTAIGVITDFDGKFVLDVPNGNSDIIFSYIGYKDQIIKATGKEKLHIVLKEDNQQLEEVVVVGYGTQKKANLSGSVASVGSEALEGKPIVSAGQGLQGVIPNLNISIKSGDPSQSPTYNIRGNTSINGGGPLVLVDGVPMSVDDLNPNDIKSVTVLKDAGSAAIYGARAAFGVILVETKNATEGKSVIKFNAELTLNCPIFNMDPVTDPYEYVNLFNSAQLRDLKTAMYDDDYVAGVKAYKDDPVNNPEWSIKNGEYRFYGNNNYRNRIITDSSPMQKYDLSISGSGQKNKYYLSFGFMDTKGFYKPSSKNEDYKRFNVIAKNDVELNSWLKSDSKIIFNSNTSDKVHIYDGEVSLTSFARVAPVRAIDFPSGVPGYESLAGSYFNTLNMIPMIENGGRDINRNNTIWLTQGLTASPIKDLKLRAEFSYKVNNSKTSIDAKRVFVLANGQFDGGSNYASYGKTANDFISDISTNNQYYVINAFAEYSKTLGDHYLKVMGGYNQEWLKNTSVTAKAFGHASQSISDVSATIGAQQTFGAQSELALMGYFSRVNYSFKDRYLFEFNGRYDGTSRFPSDSRFGFFPSFSAAWRISNEKFMEWSKPYIDNLKLRASYGELGNQAVSSYYPYISTMAVGTSTYQFDNSGFIPTVSAPGLVSPSLTWESVVTTNFGIDILLLNQRLDISFDAYKRKTKDMLMGVAYPSTLGTASPQENGADLETKGWELAVKWRDNIGKDFNYDITLSLSDYQAEITRYNNPTGAIDNYYVGKKLGEIWGFRTYGIFQSEEEIAQAPSQKAINTRWIPGDIRFCNLNDDDVISRGNRTLDDHGDLEVIGNTTPRYSYGVNLNMSYKNFSLSMFFQGVGKRDYYPATGGYTWFFPYLGENIEKYWIDECWSEDNRDAYFPGPLYNNAKNYESQTRFLQNAAYCRLKNLMIGYNLPKSFINKVGIQSARISLSGANLFTITNIHKPLDPEYIYSGNMTYPLMKTYSASISLTL